MHELNQDPTPVYLALAFFAVFSMAGVLLSVSYHLVKEINTVKKNIGKDSYDFLSEVK